MYSVQPYLLSFLLKWSLSVSFKNQLSTKKEGKKYRKKEGETETVGDRDRDKENERRKGKKRKEKRSQTYSWKSLYIFKPFIKTESSLNQLMRNWQIYISFLFFSSVHYKHNLAVKSMAHISTPSFENILNTFDLSRFLDIWLFDVPRSRYLMIKYYENNQLLS